MKPVRRGPSPGNFPHYRKAKSELLSRLGLHCSYCEQAASAQDLDVEHIYPKKPHRDRMCVWDNFLVSCSTCNTYKMLHLGSGPQVDLEGRYLWPHLDNTFRAFEYFDDGRMAVAPGVPHEVVPLAKSTMDMAGLMVSPHVASEYDLAIAYDIMSKRKEMWDMATSTRQVYVAAKGAMTPEYIATQANMLGHFSIWMAVFRDHPDVRRELIAKFKADPSCFDDQAAPVAKGRV